MKQDFTSVSYTHSRSLSAGPYGDSIFLFSGWSKDRYKCLYFDGDGFVMLYKRLDNGKLQCPKIENEVRNLNQQELRWLLEGNPPQITEIGGTASSGSTES